MDKLDGHPGIVFRGGPTGERAALAAGPDVWEVIAALHAVSQADPGLRGDRLRGELESVTGLDASQVNAALQYYSAYPLEIDERISLNNEAAEQGEAGHGQAEA